MFVVFANVLDKVLHQLQDAILAPDVFPQVRRGETVTQLRGRVAGPFVLAFADAHVEGQEVCVFALELRRHVDEERIDGKMGDAAAVQEQRLAGIARPLVLGDRVADVLSVERVFQFNRKQRQPVAAGAGRATPRMEWIPRHLPA